MGLGARWLQAQLAQALRIGLGAIVGPGLGVQPVRSPASKSPFRNAACATAPTIARVPAATRLLACLQAFMRGPVGRICKLCLAIPFSLHVCLITVENSDGPRRPPAHAARTKPPKHAHALLQQKWANESLPHARTAAVQKLKWRRKRRLRHEHQPSAEHGPHRQGQPGDIQGLAAKPRQLRFDAVKTVIHIGIAHGLDQGLLGHHGPGVAIRQPSNSSSRLVRAMIWWLGATMQADRGQGARSGMGRTPCPADRCCGEAGSGCRPPARSCRWA